MITTNARSGWSKPKPSNEAAEAAWSPTRVVSTHATESIGQTEAFDRGFTGVWQQSEVLDIRARVRQGESLPLDRQDSFSVWGSTQPADVHSSSFWDKSILPVDVQYRCIYNPSPAWKDRTTRARSRRSAEFKRKLTLDQVLDASLYKVHESLAFVFNNEAYYPSTEPPVFYEFRYVPPQEGIMATDSMNTRPRWGNARSIAMQRGLHWGKARMVDGVLTGITYPDYTGPVLEIKDPPKDPELQEAYMIGNLVTVTEVVSELPIQASNISLSYDADSFSWSLNMDVMGKESMNAIRPDKGGVKNVRIDVNGHQWVFLVEKYRRNFKFAQETYSVTGSSRTQLLTEPYAPASSGTNINDISARQIIDGLLMNTGFVLQWAQTPDYDVPDWIIPAGAFSYQDQTPLQLIARLSEAAGAITSPGMDTDTITILPRYVMPVWDWTPQFAHKILPSAVITNLGGEWSPNPTWDSCYVSGTNYGVSTMVRRRGTAGNKPAADVFDDLMTDPGIAAYRGKVEICKGGDQELVTLQLPLFPKGKPDTPGLVTPGMLCDVREDGLSWVGLCLSTSISCSGVGASVVTQSIKLERHTSEI